VTAEEKVQIFLFYIICEDLMVLKTYCMDSVLPIISLFRHALDVSGKVIHVTE